MVITAALDGIGFAEMFASDGMGLVRRPLSIAKAKSQDDEWDEALMENDNLTFDN